MVVQNPYSGQERRIEEVDPVVLVTAKEPCNGLYGGLAGRVPEVYQAGDCNRAVSASFAIGEAIRDGHRVGRKI